MMSLLDIRRAILESQPAAINRLARILLAAFLREAGPDGDWQSVARRHLHRMAAGALLEERALGEQHAMAFVGTTLAPVAGLAPIYRGAGETDLAELANLLAGIGTERLAAEARWKAVGNAREAVLTALSRSRESGSASAPSSVAGRETKAALRRLFSVAAPALRFELALDASQWIASQAPKLPLSTLARTPYEEMLVREIDLLEELVSAYLGERWFRDSRYWTLFAAIPQEALGFLGRAFGEGGDDGLLRSVGSAIVVPALDRLDQLDFDGRDADGFATVVELGRRLADWLEKLIASEPSLPLQDPRRPALERLRARHGLAMDVLLVDLRRRCVDATRPA